ncbi:MAG: urease accessory UreF family protein [Chthoniobacterales bacterium]
MRSPDLPADSLPWLPFLLQTSDALFPTGAYAHSLGFEEIVRLRVVSDETSLGHFLHQQLLPALAGLELPTLRFAYDCDSTDDLLLLDREISAWKLARETREASAQLGTRRLKALQSIHPSPLLADFAHAIRSGHVLGHHLIVCALQARIEAVPLPAALTVYAYQSLAACCGAALKLIRIGQDGCQRVLRNASAAIPGAVASSMEVARADAGSFNPMLEIASMRHAHATERLFIS